LGFGLLYLGVSIYGIKSNKDNIGHDAHLGGAIVGMLFAILFIPEILQENLWVILLLLIPSLVFIYIIVTRPYLLLIDNFYFKTINNMIPLMKDTMPIRLKNSMK
jgi:uncharacterized membrane protein YccC